MDMTQKLIKFVARTQCACIDTPEYAEYEQKVSVLSTPEERVLERIFNPFVGEQLAYKCERCQLLDEHDDQQRVAQGLQPHPLRD